MADTLLQEISQATIQSNTESFKQSEQRLLKFIAETNKQNKEIRIWLPASSNFGNQSSSVNIMYRLASKGVQAIRLVYFNGDEQVGSNWEKLRILILGLPEKPPAAGYPLPGTNTTLFFSDVTNDLDSGNWNMPYTTPLGITGGWDNEIIQILDAMDIIDFCCLQPFLWRAHQENSNLLYITCIDESTEQDQETYFFPKEYRIPNRAYYIPNPTLTPYDRQTFEKVNPRKFGAVTTIEALVDEGKTRLVTVYVSEKRVGDLYEILFNLILGIIYYQKKHVQKVLIALPMNPLPGTMDALQYLLNGFVVTKRKIEGKNYQIVTREKDAFKNRYNYLQSKGYYEIFQRVTILKEEDTTGENITKAINNPAYQIVLANIGNVPKVVFDYLFSLNNLTSVFEGMGTATLAVNLGKPFIRVLGGNDLTNLYRQDLDDPSNTEFGKDGAHIAEITSQKQILWNQALGSSNPPNTSNPDEVIGDFLLNANNPDDGKKEGDNWYKFFKNQRKFFHDEENDKLMQALNYWASTRYADYDTLN
ncbi:MAG TPA: hypothetical protein DCS93_01350 [Microscillaceae bacterium]|nr:hypothetical protein [Microscillaceae bacterium]